MTADDELVGRARAAADHLAYHGSGTHAETVRRLTDRIEALSRQIAERSAAPDAVREALEPFASYAEKVDAHEGVGAHVLFPDDYVIASGKVAGTITFGDLRKARAALSTPASSGWREAEADWPIGSSAVADFDDFNGTVQGYYRTREGKPGVVLQMHGKRITHVYGAARLSPSPKPAGGDK